jgi:two-component system NtrC family response regulator
MARILIIDDDPQICETLESLVQRLEHEATSAQTMESGLALAREGGFDVVFLDVQLPDGNGLSALPALTGLADAPEVIILTGRGDPDGAELAMQAGVWDYLTKPSNVKEIKVTLHRALKYRTEKAASEKDQLDLSGIVGRSNAVRARFDQLAQAARSDAAVLITGPTGTGKELFARTIHDNSRRTRGQFVVVDCAALTESLVESTLFGHKKGAFTGAERDRVGLVKLAHGGTLFLDEVGEMPLSIQKTFLRVLQERRFRPVGDTKETSSDFRIIAATNRDPASMVEEGRFRKDLYFRLGAITIDLPPLTGRRDDIRPLATHFANDLIERYGIPTKGFDADFVDVLQSYTWPGNVRELQNVMERAFAAAGEERMLYAKHLPRELRAAVARVQLEERPARAHESCPEPCTDGGELPSLKDFKGQAEREYLLALLARHEGDTPRLLEVSGLSRSHFYALLKKHDIAD